MKHPYLALATLGLLTATSAFAGTTTSSVSKNPVMETPPSPSDAGFFIGADAGAFWLQKISAGGPLSVDLKFKDGWGIDVPLGYNFGNGWSLGVSGGYDTVDFKSVTGSFEGSRQSASTSGKIEFIPVMANASYSVKLSRDLSWYVGAGAGGVRTRAHFRSFDNDAGRSITFGQLGGNTAAFDGLDNTSWDFGFQAFTGLAYQVSRNASIDLGYHYLRINDKFSVNGDSSSNLNTHLVSLGVVFKF